MLAVMDASPSSAKSGVYTIPAGVDFLGTLAEHLLGEAKALENPRDLGAMCVFLPTRRAVRVLEEKLLEPSRENALLLPRIIPLGGIEELEEFDTVSANEFHNDDEVGMTSESLVLDSDQARSSLSDAERQFHLTRLILHWSERSSSRIAGSPAQAAQLALDLGRLLDTAERQGIDLARLHDLAPDPYAENWKETLLFLRIIIDEWPKFLNERGCISESAKQDATLRALVNQWARKVPQNLIIAAGTTGSIPAVADLLKCVASLPRGTVLLPGLDKDMEDDVWKGLKWEHPQHDMKLLLEHIGIDRGDVRFWANGVKDETPERKSRRKLLNLAFYPAEKIDAWQSANAILSTDGKPPAGLQLIEAPGRREEAGMIALMLRDLLEQTGKCGALVTPDRELALWVRGEMHRWGVEIYDSAGDYFRDKEEMRFARLLGEAVADSLAPASLLALLKHPLARLGMRPARLRRSVELMERFLLRGLRPPAGIAGLRFALQQTNEHARFRPTRHQRREIRALINSLERALAPLASVANQRSFRGWLDAHIRALDSFAAETESAPSIPNGDEIYAFFSSLMRDGAALPRLTFRQYLDLLANLAASQRVAAPSWQAHPRLYIWGLLEAGLQQVDLMILGGLNEGTWPGKSLVGPWLNRHMLRQLGLRAPEWRIGRSALNFVQGAMQPQVVLSRAIKIDGTPTVKSRWLLRLETLLQSMGMEGIGEDREFSAKLLARYQSLDGESKNMKSRPCQEPAPCPPLEARPRKFAVTDIERLIEDPYTIFARNILFLKPLEPLDVEFHTGQRGLLLHRILENFTRRHPREFRHESFNDIIADFLSIAEEQLAPLKKSQPETVALLRPSLEVLARQFAAFELPRRPAGIHLLTEARGSMSFDLQGMTHTLTCYADRIEIKEDGAAIVCDYKSGTPPSARDVLSGKKPQLPLEALILQEGSFAGHEGRVLQPEKLVYISARAREGLGAELNQLEIVPKDMTLEDFLRETMAGLKHLLGCYLDVDTPYRCWPWPDSRPMDYVHLARIREWSSSGDET